MHPCVAVLQTAALLLGYRANKFIYLSRILENYKNKGFLIFGTDRCLTNWLPCLKKIKNKKILNIYLILSCKKQAVNIKEKPAEAGIFFISRYIIITQQPLFLHFAYRIEWHRFCLSSRYRHGWNIVCSYDHEQRILYHRIIQES